MATLYILHSRHIDRFYIGSCLNIEQRMQEHLNHTYKGFTSKAKDWKMFLTIDDLDYQQARNIEKHIKAMKSKKYIQNLITYPEIIEKLKTRFQG